MHVIIFFIAFVTFIVSSLCQINIFPSFAQPQFNHFSQPLPQQQFNQIPQQQFNQPSRPQFGEDDVQGQFNQNFQTQNNQGVRRPTNNNSRPQSNIGPRPRPSSSGEFSGESNTAFIDDNNNDVQSEGFITGGPITQSTRRTTTTSTTTSSEFTQCTRDCSNTAEYNPVCGTDNLDYNNPGAIKCARNCGKDVSLAFLGKCKVRLGLEPAGTDLNNRNTFRRRN